MLEIVGYNEDEYGFPCLLVLGCFDGVHIGHAELLKKAKLQAKINGLDLGVMMFAEGKGGKQVYTFEERVKLLEQFNVKFVLKIDFTNEFKTTKPLDFLQNIEDKLNVKAYMSGKDFRFGAGAKGKSSTLKNYAEDEENGVWYMSVKDVLDGAEKVSTTLIKSLLESGEVARANELLGRNFSVTGKVCDGANRGGKLVGYPTLNLIYPENKADLKRGVYEVKCVVCGEEYKGVANYGARPTFDDAEDVLEVHLSGYNGNCRGEEVTVEFVKYIREIRKFNSAEELAAQIAADLGGESVCVIENTEIAEEPAMENLQVEETCAAETEPAVEISEQAEQVVCEAAVETAVSDVEESASTDSDEVPQSQETDETPADFEEENICAEESVPLAESDEQQNADNSEFEDELNEVYEGEVEAEPESEIETEQVNDADENKIGFSEDDTVGNAAEEVYVDNGELAAENENPEDEGYTQVETAESDENSTQVEIAEESTEIVEGAEEAETVEETPSENEEVIEDEVVETDDIKESEESYTQVEIAENEEIPETEEVAELTEDVTEDNWENN